VKPASRNLFLELAALGLFLVSLVPLLMAGLFTSLFVINGLLPNEPPIQTQGIVVGRYEAWAGALSMIVPAVALIAAAWGLRSLAVDEEGQDV
jgi:uncharacterized membrane protein